jgi:hypothetical protein
MTFNSLTAMLALIAQLIAALANLALALAHLIELRRWRRETLRRLHRRMRH